MASSGGWYLVGPLLAVTLLAVLVALLALRGWSLEREHRCDPAPRDWFADGLAIFRDRLGDGDDDYGLLSPAALTDDLELAEDVRQLLAAAGIRATYAVRGDGRVTVLVFPEEADEARRLVGGFPAL